MASSLRTKKYRKFLFSEQELQSKATELTAALGPLQAAWQEGKYQDYDVVAQYILIFLKIFRPKDYLGGPHNENISRNLNYSEFVKIFATHSLRSVPLAVNRALVAWAEGRHRLHLVDYIPDARFILEKQAKGERVVTCLFQPNELVKWVEGKRDPLGFVLHDLIHADHFFHDEKLSQMQTEFYCDVLGRLNSGEFSRFLNTNPEFATQFEYVVSDMNSHPVHLEQTLQAILSIAKAKDLQ